MLKLVVSQEGLADREFVVPGDVATVGRVSSCDVQIDEPFVSKQHLRIFHGTVVVDLGSSNGSFIDGRRVSNGVLLEGRSVAISQNGVELRVVAADSEHDTAMEGSVDYDLEKLRSEYALLDAEASRLRRELTEARSGDDRDELVGRLQGENESLRQRLESLKRQWEDRELEEGESPQARLLQQLVENFLVLIEILQAEIDRLQLELQEREQELEVRLEAAKPASPMAPTTELLQLQQEVTDLRAALESEREGGRKHEDQTALVRKLRRELETLRASPQAVPAAPDLEQALQDSRNETIGLRAKVAELEGRLAEGAAAPEGNVSDLFFKLQQENMELKKKLSAAGGGGGQAEPGKRDVKTVKELMEARLEIARLETELSNLKVTNVPTLPKLPAKKATGAGGPAPGGGEIRQVFELLVDKDVEGLVRPTSGPVESFILIESVRLLRHVERVVTRVAGDLIQLFQLQTMLPDTSGTYRGIVSDLLSRPESSSREELVEYLEELGRWLVASIGAHRQAAVCFAEKIKDDLTEKSLTARDPLPPYARVPMLAGNELWRRVQDYLVALSPDNINEGIDDLAREQAQRILNESA